MKKRKTTVHPMQHHDRITPWSPPGPSVPALCTKMKEERKGLMCWRNYD
jgi:hypothetical protein